MSVLLPEYFFKRKGVYEDKLSILHETSKIYQMGLDAPFSFSRTGGDIDSILTGFINDVTQSCIVDVGFYPAIVKHFDFLSQEDADRINNMYSYYDPDGRSLQPLSDNASVSKYDASFFKQTGASQQFVKNIDRVMPYFETYFHSKNALDKIDKLLSSEEGLSFKTSEEMKVYVPMIQGLKKISALCHDELCKYPEKDVMKLVDPEVKLAYSSLSPVEIAKARLNVVPFKDSKNKSFSR